MRYLIQIFRTYEPGDYAGFWSNTAWGGDDLARAEQTARQIAAKNAMGIRRVRVVEVLLELECEPQPAAPEPAAPPEAEAWAATHLMPVQFLEDRDGRALVRLRNGSKTTVDHADIKEPPPRTIEEALERSRRWRMTDEEVEALLA